MEAHCSAHGDMADMITIRRFETDSAVALAPYLMELQDEPLSATFDEGTFNTFSIDGKVYWYPAPGMYQLNPAESGRNGEIPTVFLV